MSSAPRFSRVGTLVEGKYRVVRLLGAGGMSEVYEARHLELQRRAAIKFLLPEVANEPESVARFRREARTAGSLHHENVAACYDAGVDHDGSQYLVMEFLEGADCAALLRAEGCLGRARAIDMIMQVCRGASAAHGHGIVHRDLKPANLFLCRRGDGTDLVKVLDFGIAKPPRSPDANVSTGHAALGTPHYMSPEQARGDRNLDERSDIYSLGVILYEFLSGKKPHDGSSPLQILHRIVTREPLRLQELRRDLPVALCAVAERAMAKEPAERFASMDEFLRGLQPFAATTARGRRSATGSSPAETLRSPLTVSTGDARAAQPDVGVARPRRRTWRLLAAALVVAGVALAWIGRSPRPAEPPTTPPPARTLELGRSVPSPASKAVATRTAPGSDRLELPSATEREPNASERSSASTDVAPTPAPAAAASKKARRGGARNAPPVKPVPWPNADVAIGVGAASDSPPSAAPGRLQIDHDNPYR